LKISSLLDITGGVLLNSPAISFITQIHTKVHKINEGDLFISSNTDEIYEAVSRGAFCIITDNDMLLSDPEIAWIKVDDINKTAIKLVRFLFANKKLESFYFDSISYELLEIYNPDKSKYFFLNSGLEAIELQYKIEENTTIVSLNKDFLYDIYPNSKEFETKDYKITNLTIHSLFEVSFSISNKLFTKLRLPASYIYHFLSIKEFYGLNNIDENKIKHFNAMDPIFLNKSLQVVDFGKSNRFIITADDPLKIQFDTIFIENFYNYGSVKFIDVKNYDDISIYNIIKEINVNCLYLTNANQDQIRTILFKFEPQSTPLL
jgi:ferrochelatase